jgi:DNA-binding transcriptional LysR family regulator
MNYTLHQLRIFAKVAECKSITRAAIELHMTQPAVSIQLRNLQQQFDVPLTEVIGRQLYVTDFGEEILTSALEIIDKMEAIQQKTVEYKGHLTGKLKLSIVSTGKYIIPYFLTDFLKAQPGIELILDVTNRTKVLESLGENIADFGLVSVLPEKLSINKVELMQNRLYVIGNKDRLFGSGEHPVSLLKDLPVIFREKGSGTRRVMEQFLSDNAIAVNKTMELTSNEAVKQAVIAGLGYSIMPLIGIKNELSNGSLQIIAMDNFPISSIWNLIWLSSKHLSPVANAFLEFIHAEKARIIQQTFSWYDSY